MKGLLFICFLFLSPLIWSQNLSCSDFKKGTFKSVNPKADNQQVTIKRTRDAQIEIVELDGTEHKFYTSLQWIDDCSFRLKYDGNKMKLTDMQLLINSFNGIIVNYLGFDKKCALYSATLLRPDGKKIVQQDKMCIE